jgi:protein TonB
MKAPRKEKHFIKKPVYPGGPKALWTFIRKNLRYPKEALEQNISGVVRIRYSIDGKGKVISTQVIHSLGYGCDEEASRVIRMLQYEVPRHRKLKVKYFKTINVKFRAPKKKSIQVTLTKSPQEKEKKEEKKGGYEYTIRF